MSFTVDGRQNRAASAARRDGLVGGGLASPSPAADDRRYGLEESLRTIEDTLIVIDHERALGVEAGGLAQLRDELGVLLLKLYLAS